MVHVYPFKNSVRLNLFHVEMKLNIKTTIQAKSAK